MKVTLFAGLLLAGASIPALKAVPEGQDYEARVAAAVDRQTIAELRGAAPEAMVPDDDELNELREVQRQLELTMERLEHAAEIRNLERSIERRQEMRKRQQELAEQHSKTEREYHELERMLDRREQEFEYGHERMSHELERRLEEIEHEFEEHMQRVEAAHEHQIRSSLQAAREKGMHEDKLEPLEAELRLEMIERSQKDARKFRERSAEVRAEGERELRAHVEEYSEVEEQMRSVMSELEARADDLTREAEIMHEDAEARAELEGLKLRLDLVEQSAALEHEYDEIERRIEQLEDARDEDDDCEDEDEDDDRDDDDDDLDEVWHAIKGLQDAVAELRRDVDALAKKISVR